MGEKRIRILVINGEANQRERVIDLLQKNNLCVDAAATADQACSLISQSGEPYDLALIDELLPGSSSPPAGVVGLQVIAQIKALWPAIEIIAFIDQSVTSIEKVLRAGALRYLTKPINLTELAILVLQVVEQLEARASERKTLEGLMETQNASLLRDAERRVRNLGAILKVSSTISSSLDLDKTLKAACRAAVELLGVDHSGLVLFSPDQKTGWVRAEYPEDMATRGLEIPLLGVPSEEHLISSQGPIIINDVAGDSFLGPVRDILVELNICSILIVPIIIRDTVVGSFSLDAVGRKHIFKDEEIEMCKVFASQVAMAIKNAQLYANTRRQVRKLQALQHTTLAINSTLDRHTLLRTIIGEAVQLLKASSGGIYEYFPERCELIVIADFNRPQHLNNRLRRGEGMAGRLVENEQSCMIIPDYNRWEGKATIYDDNHPFGAVLGVPLKWKERVMGILYIDDVVGREFTQEDAQLLGMFADQAALALANAEFIARDEEKVKRLEGLSRATTEIMKATKLEKRLDLITKHTAEILEAKTCSAYLVNNGALHLAASYGRPEGLAKGDEIAIGNGLKTSLISRPSERPDELGSSVLKVDLKRKKGANEEELIGLLCLENKKGKANGSSPTESFSKEDEWVLKIFAEASVVAIENAGLVKQLSEQKDTLDLLLKASNLLSDAGDMARGLDSLAEMMVSRLSHTFCRILLLDEGGSSLKVMAASYVSRECRNDWEAGVGQSIPLSLWPGVEELLNKGKPAVIKSPQSHDNLTLFSDLVRLRPPVQSLLLVPLKIKDKVLGLMDLGEMRSSERAGFTEETIELAKAIAAQTASLIDRMYLNNVSERSRMELEHLLQATQAMSGAFDLNQVLQTIVESVKGILSADSVAIWSYDNGMNRFIPEELVAVSIPDEELSLFREEEPEPGRTAFTVLKKGWLGVTDISLPEYDFLGDRTRALLERINVRSFEGILLNVNEEPVGVLYVNYKDPRTFGEEGGPSLNRLAKYAALSLKKARLLNQVKKAQKAAQVVARMMAVGKLEATLDSITTCTLEVIDCDAAVLYVYDSALDCLSPPVTKGVHHPERVSGYKDVPNSLVYEMLQRSEPYIVERVDRDPLFEGARFAKDEQIKSGLAIPLKAAEQKVGVLFVNYRKRHRFTADELTSAELFANQAAVAIRNAQLFMEKTRRLHEQEKLGQLSKGFLSSDSVDEILELATGLAADLLRADGSDIILRGRNEALVFSASTGWEMMTAKRSELDRRNWSHVDYAIRAGEPVTIFDYADERRFSVPFEILASGFRSGLIVPISIGNEVMGTMSVHTRARCHFTEAETTLLSIVTHQAAIAIKNVRQYESIRRHSASFNALYRAGKAITACLELGRKQMLDRIAEQAVECLTVGKGLTIAFGTIQLYDESTGELHFESTCCSRDYPDVRARLGEVRPIKQRISTGVRIGISGRTVLANAPQIVADVSTDPDYVQFDPLVRSALTVPLVDKEKVIGVLGLESNQPEAFDEDDKNTLLALAELAVIAIRNAEQYDDLRKTRTLAEARTALAWMGMTSSAWRHTIHGYAITINDLVDLASSAVDNRSLAEVSRKLGQISEMASLIQKHPITAPLISEESVRSVLVNALLRERLRQLWDHGVNKSVTLRFDFALPGSATVRANPDWLIRALDVLVDNAIEAMKDRDESVLTVGSRRENKSVHIEITDTGKGIPPDVLKKLLQEPIEHLGDSKQLGLGLLMARLIVQVYGGDISCQSTDPAGTTMVISLPLEAESVKLD